MAKVNMKPLVEKYNELLDSMEAVTNKAVEETRALTEEEKRSFDEMKAQADELKKTIDLANEERELMEFTDEPKKKAEVDEERAFDAFLRSDEARALAKSDNGVIVPVKIAERIIEEVKNLSPILQMADVYYTGGKLVFPVWNDSYTSGTGTQSVTHNTAAAYVDEFTDVTEDSGKFTSVELNGFIAGILVKISKSLINNAAFDVVSYFVEKCARKIAEFLNKELVVGTENKMEGILSATNGVTAAATTEIDPDELIALQLKVPQVYQNDAVWIMNSDTFAAVRQMKSEDGHYLVGGWTDGLRPDMGFTLLGKRVYLDDNMPDIAASAKPVFYGNLKGLAVKFSDRLDLEVLREKYATQYAIGIVAHCEADSKIVDNSMLALLTMKAS